MSKGSRDSQFRPLFKLKDELYGHYDPFYQYLTKQHELNEKGYENHKLEDKFVAEGLNDIVGEYLNPPSYSTPLNHLVQDAMCESKVIELIIPILLYFMEEYGKARDFSQQKQLQDDLETAQGKAVELCLNESPDQLSEDQ